MIKNPPAMQEAWIRSLGWEDPLEEGTATHSSMENPGLENTVDCVVLGVAESDTTE